ncbi:hypothetical protein BN970_03971 [Mycolicibacterium conceptionense]|uniref:Uncharacterized protein n=1 Tax=Mycolicibacterium conceptionense TaxID=451644 RepID=A0A0U1DKC0_9MYCO|nr:hypothetical protein BN970_03971 [Mycolicibacterium conceptionense]
MIATARRHVNRLVRSPALGVAVLAPIVLVAGAGSTPGTEVSDTAVTPRTGTGPGLTPA